MREFRLGFGSTKVEITQAQHQEMTRKFLHIFHTFFLAFPVPCMLGHADALQFQFTPHGCFCVTTHSVWPSQCNAFHANHTGQNTRNGKGISPQFLLFPFAFLCAPVSVNNPLLFTLHC